MMALPQLACLTNVLPLDRSTTSSSNTAFAAKSKNFNLKAPKPNSPTPIIQFQCNASLSVSNHSHSISRRSAHFQRSVWHYDYIQSLNSKYTEESYGKQIRVLREEVRMMLHAVENPVHQLGLIDTLQRLGVAYHFYTEINNMLKNIYNKNVDKYDGEKSLYDTALEFRLLRQHGYNLSTEVYERFQDETGNFHKGLSLDIKGMLSLYEASFHSMEGEIILEKARDFTSRSLKEFMNKNQGHHQVSLLSLLVSHALELPLHWRMPRWEAIWFINEYERSPEMNPTLLKLAKLDFNMVQAIHQDELKNTSRWWERIGLEKRFKFFRSRLVDNYFWALGMNFEPHLGNFRRVTAKAISLITLIDDIYDVHATLEELELFTEAIDRLDMNAIDNLPYYMKICFLELYNFVNELAFDIRQEKGQNVLSHLKKVWTDICKAYLIEAKWYHNGHTPGLQEYMENGWISISGPLILLHAYLLISNPIRKEDLDGLEENPNLIYLSGFIFRLLNDIGSFKREMKTGDVASSIQCYMNESGACEAKAMEHIKSMIYTTWQRMNEEVLHCPFSPPFKHIALDLVRTTIFFYRFEVDGYTIEDPDTKNGISSLLMEPIPITCAENSSEGDDTDESCEPMRVPSSSSS